MPPARAGGPHPMRHRAFRSTLVRPLPLAARIQRLTQTLAHKVQRQQRARQQQAREQLELQQRTQRETQQVSRLQNCVNAPQFMSGWIQYSQLPGVKALAIVISSDGRCSAGWVFGGPPGAMQSEANGGAISSCQRLAAQAGIYDSCMLYAEGHNIILH